ncbi:hypothetical protein OIO90_000618 [Microbotryomycetes sp. JL221]|nr:hypothetical protein OIO90_000618 [Microbotryomycetes sp. JL221]
MSRPSSPSKTARRGDIVKRRSQPRGFVSAASLSRSTTAPLQPNDDDDHLNHNDGGEWHSSVEDNHGKTTLSPETVRSKRPRRVIHGRSSRSTYDAIDWFGPLRTVIKLVMFFLTFFFPYIASGLALLVFAVLVRTIVVNSLTSSVSTLTSAVMMPATFASHLYCSTIGIGCNKLKHKSNNSRSKSVSSEFLGTTAHETTVRVEQAMDLFQALLALGGPDSAGLTLQPVAVWELSNMVRFSKLEESSFVANELNTLGDSIRDVKDKIISVNAQGMNAFIWTVQDFSRLQDVIKLASANPGSYTEEQLSDMLEKFFARMDRVLGELLTSLDSVVPLAEKVSSHSRLIRSTLSEADSSALAERNTLSLYQFVPLHKDRWRKLQIDKDLRLTNASIDTVANLVRQVEHTRNGLLAYRESVGQYKAAIIGYHLSGLSLSAEHEVLALDSVMKDFKSTISEARRRALPNKQSDYVDSDDNPAGAQRRLEAAA